MDLNPLTLWQRWRLRGTRPQPEALTASAHHLLHKRLEHARLAKMLQRMHVSRDVYLKRIHPDVLREQLDTCAACPHVFLCDPALACPRAAPVDLAFCPNQDSIRSVTRAT